jgi:hypothetical protein
MPIRPAAPPVAGLPADDEASSQAAAHIVTKNQAHALGRSIRSIETQRRP